MMHEHDRTDAELIDAVRKGDSHAFEGLVARYHPGILAFCTKLLGNPQDSEEIAPDTFMGLYAFVLDPATRTDVNNGLHDKGICSWLMLIARNKALDRLRYIHRRPPLSAASLGLDVTDRLVDEDPGADPEHVCLNAESEELLWKILEEVPPRYRRLLQLTIGMGLNSVEAAQILDINANTARSWRGRGLVQLRKIIESDGRSYVRLRSDMGPTERATETKPGNTREARGDYGLEL